MEHNDVTEMRVGGKDVSRGFCGDSSGLERLKGSGRIMW